MSFILLGADNKVLQEGIQKIVAAEKKEPCDTTLYDFDNVSYHLVVDKDDRTRLSVSLQCPNWNVFKSQGSEEWIKQKLGEYIKTFTADGVDFEISLGEEKSAERAELIGNAFSKLRVYALGGPLYQYCKALSEKKALKELFEVKFRPDMNMWICPGADRLTIVFSLEFPIRADRVIANQVLSEFVEVRRQRDVSNTPVIAYSKDPPMELKTVKIPNYDKTAFLGYFSVLLLPEHIKEGKLETAVENVIGFRAYLTYHIKCAKAFFHSRMRSRVKTMLQILNRARYEPDDERKKKKIIVGADYQFKNLIDFFVL